MDHCQRCKRRVGTTTHCGWCGYDVQGNSNVFWLYLGDTIVASVLLHDFATEEEIKAKALADLESVPGVVTPKGLAPFEQANRIRHSHVRVFSGHVSQ